MISTFEAAVHSLYFAYYGRPADPDGLAFWSEQLERAGGDIGAIADVFANAEEATVRFGGDSTAERVAGVYQQLFNRAPDADGLRFWTDAVDAGHTTLADVALNILQGAQGSDVAISGLRLKAAEDFTASVAAGQVAYGGYAAIEASRVLLAAVDADTTEAEIAVMVTKVGKLVNIAHDTPEVLAALGAGGELAPLFATARGRAEPGDLFDAVIDVATMAAGSAATLASLLRGGGIEAMLGAMPARATLRDVVEALGKGGLEAAIGVVYPPKPTPTPKPTPVPDPKPEPTPDPAPTLPTYALKDGVLTVAGGDADSQVLVMLPSRIDVNGMTVLIDGFQDVESVVLDEFKGKIAMLGTLDEIAAAAPKSPGIAYQIADGKDAIFTGPPSERTLVEGIDALLAGASLVRIMDDLSVSEHALLVALEGFDMKILDAKIDTIAPSISGIAFAAHDGVLAVGDSIQLEVKFKEQVYVEDGTTIHFANGGSAVYVKGNYGTTLTFKYTVQAGQDTASLALDADQPLHGAIFDRAGNALPLDAFEALPLGNAPAVEAPAEEEAGPLQVTWSKVVGSIGNADVVFAFEGGLGDAPVQASAGQWGGAPEVDALAGTVTLRGVDLSAAGSAIKVTLVDSAGKSVDAQLDLHVGDEEDNVLAGGDGSDYLYGGGGRNTYIGGKGADHIELGRGEVNELVFNAGDSTAWDLDVVMLPERGYAEQQTFTFDGIHVSQLAGNYGMPQIVDDSNPDGLIAALADAIGYEGKHGAALVEFGNEDKYLVVDTGNGVVDAADFVVKIIGDYNNIFVVDGAVVFNQPS